MAKLFPPDHLPHIPYHSYSLPMFFGIFTIKLENKAMKKKIEEVKNLIKLEDHQITTL